jgi:uncharacterized protein (DUF2147 family)
VRRHDHRLAADKKCADLLSGSALVGKRARDRIAMHAAASIVRANFWKGTEMKSLALAAAILLAAAPALAGDLTGSWLTRNGESKVAMSKCGAALCGTITGLKQPNGDDGRPKTDKHNPDASKRNRPVVGTMIVLNMTPSGTPDKWNGQVYNPEDGKTYSGSITLKGANALDLQGCVAGGLICKTQTWTRTN